MRKPIFLVLFCLAASTYAFAQSTEKKRGKAATSLAPEEPQSEYAPERKSGKAGKTTYSAEQQYYERVMAVARERRKAERIMKKPQYSNPLYFGHKRPPKKHSPRRMKYCQECGIRH